MVRPSRKNQSALSPVRHKRMLLAPGSPIMLRFAMNSPVGLFSLTFAKMSDPPRHRLAVNQSRHALSKSLFTKAISKAITK